MSQQYRTALILGTGPGLSSSLARLFTRHGLSVAVAARNLDKLSDLAAETGCTTHACDAADPAAVDRLFTEVEGRHGAPDVVVYNASARARGPITGLDPEAVRRAMEISAFGAFLAAQQAARRMLPAACCPRAMAPSCSPAPPPA
jgi:NAD(P)-dependent dehydrogenase (short-subunit alcohol dehydrogenase family)